MNGIFEMKQMGGRKTNGSMQLDVLRKIGASINIQHMGMLDHLQISRL